MRKLCAILLLLLQITAEAGFLRVPYEGIRPTGMGNAYVAIADDKNALFYNPAGLAYFEGFHANLIDVMMGFDSDLTFHRVRHALFDGQYDDVLDFEGNQYVRLGTFPSILTKYFGFGIYNNLSAYLELANLTLPNVDMYFANDLGVIAGFGVPMGKYLSVGASVRVFQRTGVDAIVTPNDLLNEVGVNQTDLEAAVFDHLKDLAEVGWAYGINVGTLLRVPLATKFPVWQLGASIEDLFGTKFHSLRNGGAPHDISSSFHLGTALIYDYQKGRSFTLALDGRDLFRAVPLFKSAHFGAELKWPGFAIRTGVYQGYLTAGITLDPLPHTKLELSTYAVELGNKLWERSQRWYLLQLTIGFRPL